MVKPIIQINNIRSQGDFRYLQIHNEPNSQSIRQLINSILMALEIIVYNPPYDIVIVYTVSHEPIFQNVELIFTIHYIFLDLTPLHLKSNNILNQKINDPCFVSHLDDLND